MFHYVGLDVSVKSVSICVVNAEGVIIARGDTTSDPDQISSFIAQHAPKVERVVHESGILAIWLTHELEKRGLPIICIDARLAHKAQSGRINKSDPGDAEGLAHLARTGWYEGVCLRSIPRQFPYALARGPTLRTCRSTSGKSEHRSERTGLGADCKPCCLGREAGTSLA